MVQAGSTLDDLFTEPLLHRYAEFSLSLPLLSTKTIISHSTVIAYIDKHKPNLLHQQNCTCIQAGSTEPRLMMLDL